MAVWPMRFQAPGRALAARNLGGPERRAGPLVYVQ